jgi:hypothetical protein
MELMTPADAMKAATHEITATLQVITEALKASGQWEGLNALIDLQRLILEVNEKLQDLVFENVQLRQKLRETEQRVRELESEKELSESIVFDGQVYWRENEDEHGSKMKEGPFCQTCYDKDSKWIRLRPSGTPDVKWLCSLCRTPVYHATPPRLKQA